MSKGCKKERAGRGDPRSSGLTLQAAAQQMKALPVHAGHRSFSPLLRCASLKAEWLPSLPRLARSKNNAARRGKICEA